tara:strand:+ start:5098 stop:6303 length:1206 start_codon:yes stop_codon:yes gene_type:complete
MVEFRWEGLTKYQEEVTQEKRWQEKLDIEKKDQELRERELELKEKTLDFKILKQGEDLAAEVLKSLGITAYGSLSSSNSSSKSSSGGINLVDGKVDQSSNTIFKNKIKDAYPGVTDEAFTRLLESTNLQPNTMELLYNALNKTSAARKKDNRPVLSREEIGTFLDDAILTEGKPFENVIEKLSKRFPNGIPDVIEQAIGNIENLVTTSVDLGAFENLNPMADANDLKFVRDEMFNTLNIRFVEFRNRIAKASDKLNNIDDKSKSRLDKALESYLNTLGNDFSTINKKQGDYKRTELFYRLGTSDLFNKVIQNIPGKDFPNSFKDSPLFKRPTQYFFIPENLAKQSGANSVEIAKRLTELGILEDYNPKNPDNFFSQYRIEGQTGSYQNKPANLELNIIPEG